MLRFSRIGPGQYQLGETGLRLRCYVDSGCLLTKLLSGEAEEQPPAIEFAKFISNLRAGTEAHGGQADRDMAAK
eukprot:g44.t1